MNLKLKAVFYQGYFLLRSFYPRWGSVRIVFERQYLRCWRCNTPTPLLICAHGNLPRPHKQIFKPAPPTQAGQSIVMNKARIITSAGYLQFPKLSKRLGPTWDTERLSWHQPCWHQPWLWFYKDQRGSIDITVTHLMYKFNSYSNPNGLYKRQRRGVKACESNVEVLSQWVSTA